MFNDIPYYSYAKDSSQESAVEKLKKWFEASKYKKK